MSESWEAAGVRERVAESIADLKAGRWSRAVETLEALAQPNEPTPIEFLQADADPDEASGVRTGDVLSFTDAWELLARCWGPMIEHDVHLAVRPFEDNGKVEGLVVVARGEAATQIRRFTRNEIPGFDGSPPPGKRRSSG